jgi:inosose dehydratase
MNHYPIAFRLAGYGPFQEKAWEHLPSLGIRYIEAKIPPTDQVDTLRSRCATAGLQPVCLQGRCDITAPEAIESMRPQLDACARLDSPLCLLCLNAGQTDRALVYDRLRAIGDIAAEFSVTCVLETHPDLAVNAEQARETIRNVNHPRIRINFDTANVYYYNRGLDVLDELRDLIDITSGIHLKDTPGEFGRWHFAALGTGIVDFPAIFRLIDHHDFIGPCTIEIQGIEGEEWDETTQLRHITDSVNYLRQIGVLTGRDTA